jgi:hypothetical protein
MCAHPYSAWRSGSRAVRAWLVCAYFAAGYVVALAALEVTAL